jgi:hypothetical protein
VKDREHVPIVENLTHAYCFRFFLSGSRFSCSVIPFAPARFEFHGRLKQVSCVARVGPMRVPRDGITDDRVMGMKVVMTGKEIMVG